jgi:hypothetical protein
MRTGVVALLAAGVAMSVTYGAHLTFSGAGQSSYRDQGPKAASGPRAGSVPVVTWQPGVARPTVPTIPTRPRAGDGGAGGTPPTSAGPNNLLAAARRGPASSTGPARGGPTTTATASTTAVLGGRAARQAAAAAAGFTVSLLSWAPGDTPATVRAACRPWATSRLDASLSLSPDLGPDAAVRGPAETDAAVVSAVSPADVAAGGAGESVVASVTASAPGQGRAERLVYLEEWVERSGGAWRVDQVVQG